MIGRCLVYGGRDWNDQDAVDRFLDAVRRDNDLLFVVTGDGYTKVRENPGDEGYIIGADWQAASWANRRLVPYRVFYANWTGEGNTAGPIRNSRMLSEGKPTFAVQFPGGKGTRDMRKKLDRAGIPVIEFVR